MERNYKGTNERGNLLLSDYKRARVAEKAKEAIKLQEKEEERLSELRANTKKTAGDLQQSQQELDMLKADIEKNEKQYKTDKMEKYEKCPICKRRLVRKQQRL